MPDIAEYFCFYGSAYMIPENAQPIDNQQYQANITIEDTKLCSANVFHPRALIYMDYDLESINSEEVYMTADGMMASSALDWRLNFEELTTTEAIELMGSIANGEI